MAKTKNNAFTIIELLVAVALLVILVALSSAVFTTTVKAHRKATASIEVTRTLRALTDQLSADFRGLRKDMPLMIRFYPTIDPLLPGDIGPSCDMIHLFADGDFQTTNQYDDNNGGMKTIVGNVARICYSHANSRDQIASPGTEDFENHQVLARKAHILTADADIAAVYGQIPRITNISGAIDYTQFETSFGQYSWSGSFLDENELEFSTITLTQWQNALNYLDGGRPDNADTFINRSMDDDSRPFISLSAMETLHLLMAQGVLDFQVQWAYSNDDLIIPATGLTPNPPLFAGIRWWPSRDPNGDEDYSDDEYDLMNGNDPFGVYFTLPNGVNTTTDPWFAIGNCQIDGGYYFSSTFYPKALKFTFTLRDTNGIFEDGKTFTHIVYLDN